MKKPLIMITNDDGIRSPGLMAAAAAAAAYGELLIAAPAVQQTGMGRAFPRTKESGMIEETLMNVGGKEYTAYAVHGSPALTVAHGVIELSERKPDLCISGINYGENLGTTLTCSGTLGAVFEASSHGIPGIAVSVSVEFGKHRSEEFDAIDWKPARTILCKFIENVLMHGMPEKTDIWNINVPACVKEPFSYRFTTQSRQNYFYFVKPEKRELGKPYNLRSIQYVDMNSLEKNSDIYAVYVENKISVTPLSTDMTVRSSDFPAQFS